MILDAGRYDLAPHAQFQILTRVLAEQRVILTVAAEGAKIGADFNCPSYDCAFHNVDNQPVIESGSSNSGEDQGDTQSALGGLTPAVNTVNSANAIILVFILNLLRNEV